MCLKGRKISISYILNDLMCLIMNSQEWGHASGWLIGAWDTMRGAHKQPKLLASVFRSDMVAGFGDVYHLEHENMDGKYRAEINITVACIDPKRIPFSSLLSFNSHWKECFIEVVRWDYISEPLMEARYDPTGNEDGRTSLLKAHRRLMDHQTPRSPPTSSSSSMAGSHVGV